MDERARQRFKALFASSSFSSSSGGRPLTSSPYKKLDQRKNQIRIAVLTPEDPSSRDQPIHLTLETVNLGNDPEYEALSYQWGDPKITTEIFLNGVSWQITKNLHSALKAFRSSSAGGDRLPVRLWIDAVCINQLDLSEKTWQIPLMFKIYSQARNVRSWLDPRDFESKERTDPAFRLLKEYSLGVIDVEPPAQGLHPDRAKAILESFGVLADIFRNQYWRRRWITQEIVLAKRLSIHCGRHSQHDLNLRNLHRKLDLLSTHLQAALPYQGDRDLWGVVDNDKDVWKAHQPLNFILNSISVIIAFDKPLTKHPYLLRDMRGAEQTGELDCVYGILGLLERDLGNSILTPDYKLPIAEVLQKFAFEFMTASKSLALMYESYPEDRKLPTWVPDLRTTSKGNDRFYSDAVALSDEDLINSGIRSMTVRSGIRFPGASTQRRPNMLAEFDHLFNASASSKFFAKPPATGIIHVRGLMVDNITDLSGHDKGYSNIHPQKLMDGWIPMDWMDMYDYATRYGDTFQHDTFEDEGLIRALCADSMRPYPIDEDGKPQPEQPMRRMTREDVEEHRRGIDAMRTYPGQFVQHPSVFLDASMSLYKFFCTGNGRIGITFAEDVQQGDYIFVVASLNMPLIIRGAQYADAEDVAAAKERKLLDPAYRGRSLTTFKVVGSCYLHGIMDGEAIASVAAERQCSVEDVFEDLFLI
ncbi:hypothetical protein CB0940_06415 [Cercospora beticola]|uniref:Heterokaryon incompatibility domain-containing protein n=1 Tax=Cercospora beticola TaxID=122368 RepID=A0A2G5HYU1_CERBT|nr:hypothetical protein CB0940_06415 [Cercospora beticola]PIA97698.1 hypothetical protein CB0940_06415 [Cercospora beticola]WPA99051.1 hypothetical protein RHO25_003665 [Cercospora beticola]CAK1360357.1 unnamed protein product [Cercospora beticola]